MLAHAGLDGRSIFSFSEVPSHSVWTNLGSHQWCVRVAAPPTGAIICSHTDGPSDGVRWDLHVVSVCTRGLRTVDAGLFLSDVYWIFCVSSFESFHFVTPL